VLFMGRLNAIKGPDLLLEAVATVAPSCPGHALVFAGPDGGMRGLLERRARAAGIDHQVKFVGWVAGSDKVAAYRAAELVVIPSRQEAMSLVVLEAGACARAVLMTDRCGFDEAVEAGAALAVPPEVGPLTTALRDALNGSAAPLGPRLQALVLRNYTWDAAVGRYALVFARMTSRGRQQ
jgi:glycosyltransferase involved in cell wall biosynthesis